MHGVTQMMVMQMTVKQMALTQMKVTQMNVTDEVISLTVPHSIAYAFYHPPISCPLLS